MQLCMFAFLQKHNHCEKHSLDQVSLYTFQTENKKTGTKDISYYGPKS